MLTLARRPWCSLCDGSILHSCSAFPVNAIGSGGDAVRRLLAAAALSTSGPRLDAIACCVSRLARAARGLVLRRGDVLRVRLTSESVMLDSIYVVCMVEMSSDGRERVHMCWCAARLRAKVGFRHPGIPGYGGEGVNTVCRPRRLPTVSSIKGIWTSSFIVIN